MIELISEGKYKVTVENGINCDGNRKRKSRNFTGTLKQAKRYELELMQKYSNKSITVDSRNMNFYDLGKMFLKTYAVPNLEINTVENYKYLLNKINDFIGAYQIEKISSLELTQLYVRLKTGVRKKEVSNYTVLHYYNLVNLIFEQAIKWKLLEFNPNKDVKRPKKEKKQAECYDLEQLKTLFNALGNECLKYQALIKLAIDSGARRSEILGLTWNDIDFNKGVITINKSVCIIDKKEVEKTLKNNSSYRNITLTTNTLKTLIEYLNETKDNDKSFKMSNRLFLQKSGKVMYPTTCGNILHKIATRCGLPKYKFHSLRHSSASIQVSLGIHAKEIQDRLGHSTINLTMSTYSHVFQSSKTEVANKLDGLFCGFSS